MTEVKRQNFAARRVLLVQEIERYCQHETCRFLNRVSLSKTEARAYTGFECERCERWQADALREPDVPEWWPELQIN